MHLSAFQIWPRRTKVIWNFLISQNGIFGVNQAANHHSENQSKDTTRMASTSSLDAKAWTWWTLWTSIRTFWWSGYIYRSAIGVQNFRDTYYQWISWLSVTSQKQPTGVRTVYSACKAAGCRPSENSPPPLLFCMGVSENFCTPSPRICTDWYIVPSGRRSGVIANQHQNQSVNLVNIVNFNPYILMVRTYIKYSGWPSVAHSRALNDLWIGVIIVVQLRTMSDGAKAYRLAADG